MFSGNITFLIVILARIEACDLIGSDGRSILDSQNKGIWAAAADRLIQEYDITVEIRYQANRKDGTAISMEGKGMMTYDALENPSHSIWVTRPFSVDSSKAIFPSVAVPLSTLKEFPHSRSVVTVDSSGSGISDDPIDDQETCKSGMEVQVPSLCHICERWISGNLFEDHSECCALMHRAEMDAQSCNDEFKDLASALQLRLDSVQDSPERVKVMSLFQEVVGSAIGILIPQEMDLCAQNNFTAPVLPNRVDSPASDTLSFADYQGMMNGSAVGGDFAIDGELRDINASSTQIFRYKSFKNELLQSLSVWKCHVNEQDAADEALISTATAIEDLVEEKISKIVVMIETFPSISHTLPSAPPDSSDVNVVDVEPLVISSPSAPAEKKSNSLAPIFEQVSSKVKRQGKKMPLRIDTAVDCAAPTVMPRFSSRRLSDFIESSHQQMVVSPIKSPKVGAFFMRQRRRSVQDFPHNGGESALSPRIARNRSSSVCDARPSSSLSTVSSTVSSSTSRNIPSIKDFEIVKAISKGAFGSVYLAKKRSTGDYFAIKVLKKSDMIAKNQVTNVKAERMILSRLDSPFVVKLYYSFQSRENLYLVMEFLNGGDCSALISAVGRLDEDWTRTYIAEIILALEYLHLHDIVHR